MTTTSRTSDSSRKSKKSKKAAPKSRARPAAQSRRAGVAVRMGARTEYRIYPSIGIARIGNSEASYFIGPESLRSVPKGPYRDASGILPQAARFRIYRVDIDANENEVASAEILPSANVRVEWSVSLANRKAAAPRIEDSLARAANPRPRNPGFSRPKLVIEAQGTVQGKNAAQLTLAGSIEFHKGSTKARVDDIRLGKLSTDAEGRLLVIGGRGMSGSPLNASIDSFSDNDGWYDSVSDGPVTATLTIGGASVPVEPAWVVVTVPRYAPEVYGIVTWYDQAISMARTDDDGTFDPPRSTSFTKDIFPILSRADGLHFVHQGTHAGGQRPLSDGGRLNELQNDTQARSRLLAKLTPLNLPAPKPEDRPLWPQGGGFRMPVLYSGANPDAGGSTWTYLSLTKYQFVHVENWVAGNFAADWPGAPSAAVPLESLGVAAQPAALNEAALEACIGGAFYPGIEGSYDMARVSTYHPQRHLRRDLRMNPSHPAGYLTEKMALPWQADFADCADNWWPSQRPVFVTKADGARAEWARGITGVQSNRHLNMVQFWSSLAHVLRKAGGPEFAEVGRKPINGVS